MSNTIFPNKTGFTQIDNELFYVQSVVSASAFSLLVRIYRATQGYGVAVKALSGVYLQKTTNLSKNTVTKATKELEAIGVLLVKRRARLSSYYQVSVKGVAKVCKEVKDSLEENIENLDLDLEDMDDSVVEESATPEVVVVEDEEPEVMALPDTGFDIFWSVYDKKVGKEVSKLAWGKLKKTDHKDIMNHLEDYVKSTPEKQYRKDPVNYLKDKVWQDEVVERVIAPVVSTSNNTQQPSKFSAPVVEVRDVVKEGTDADSKIKDFLKNYGRKGSTYA